MTTRRKSRGGQEVRFQIEGPKATRAIVVHVERKSRAGGVAGSRDAESRLEEAVGLARAIELEIVGEVDRSDRLAAAGNACWGRARLRKLASCATGSGADLVVVNAQLAPIQQRNLEKAWSAKVLDRTGLILEIFGRRAQTREGTLQVELAHLRIPEEPACPLLDPSRAPTRRLRLSRRSG